MKWEPGEITEDDIMEWVDGCNEDFLYEWYGHASLPLEDIKKEYASYEREYIVDMIRIERKQQGRSSDGS